jgi:hypothetical protein
MKISSPLVALLASALLAGFAAGAEARDDRLKMPIADATAAGGGKLDGSVKFFWGSQSYPKGGKELGTYTSNKKTNFFNKSDKEGCEWAWLSAMLALQDRAKQEGGNAVVNIHSVYKSQDFSSETEYECGAGSVMGGVALRGTVVKLP